MKEKKSASEVIGYLVIFIILFAIFSASYFFIYPLIKKSRAKSELQSIENDIIELATKLSKTFNDKTNNYMTFVIDKGILTIDNSVFGIVYKVQVAYSPYTIFWYDILNNKPAPVDVCEYNETNGNIELKNCLAQKLNAKCQKISEGILNCYFPQLNVNLQYVKISKKDLGENENGFYYMSAKPIFRVVDNENLCSVYVHSLFSQKNEQLTYYIICNIRKIGNTCYIPHIAGNVVATPVSYAKLQISYEGEKYLPDFNYFGCDNAYIENVKITMIRG
ncbi:MAG: hypothetical protein ABGW69_01205 [Nanoarchaeota archaeon]